ncbi:MAG: F/Y-rich N-terminus-domain-containing protein, partial [Piptocephalis tieghemiana]
FVVGKGLDRFVVRSLGHVVWQYPGWHTKHTIYPEGYCIERFYSSLNHGPVRVKFTCEIIPGDPEGRVPSFRVTADDEPDSVWLGSSPTAAWDRVFEAAGRPGAVGGGLRRPIQVRGSHYFGLTNPVIQEILGSLPQADRC